MIQRGGNKEMATNKRPFTLRLSEEKVFRKVQKLAKINKRSTAMQIEFILEKYIKDYENINGTIETQDIEEE